MARALIIDCHETIRNLIASFLRTHGHDVQSAEPEAAGRFLSGTADFDCIVVASPIVTESQSLLIDEIAEKHPHLLPRVVIVTTAFDDEELLRRVASLRVYAVMARPFDPADLLALLDLSARRARPPRRWYSIPPAIIDGVAAGLPGGDASW